MDFTTTQVLHTLFSLLNNTVRTITKYNVQHPDFPLPMDKVETICYEALLVSIIWAFSGDAKLDLRAEMSEFLRKKIGVDLPPMAVKNSLIDFNVQITTGE